MLAELVRYCLISSVFKPIRVEGRKIPLRSQINLLIEAPFGTGKTYIIETIRQAGLGLVMDRWTQNAFYGSISRQGTIIPPITVLAAGSTVLIDEFQSIPLQFKQPLLKLLEEQIVNRELLNVVPEPEDQFCERDKDGRKWWKIERDFYWIKAHSGYLYTHIRASYLIVTAHLGKSELEKMLMSRCITLRLDFQLEDLYTDIDIKLDDIHELRQKLKNYQGSYTAEQDKEFLDLVVQEATPANIPYNYYRRIRDNLIRIDNCINALKYGGVEVDYTAYDFLPLLLAGVKGIKFRPIELEVYAKLPHINQDDLEFVELLKQKGVVREVNGNYVRCCNFGVVL